MIESSTPEVMSELDVKTIQEMLANQGMKESSLLGIGISSIGPLDTKNGIMRKPMHFPDPGWEDVPIKP